MKKSTIALLALLLAAGCVSKETEDKAHVQTQKLAAPSEVRAERQGKDVLITWTDNSVDEAGFTVYYKKEGALLPVFLGSTKKDETSLLTSKYINVGQSYTFGVSAKSPIKESLNSDIVYSEVYFHEDLDPSAVIWTCEPEATYASIVFSYDTRDFEKEVLELGICWSEDPNPEMTDAHIPSSLYREGAQKQTVPGVLLEEGKTYHFRAYATTELKTCYSEDLTTCLAPQPEAITFDWKEITPSGYPSEVKAYSTSTTLDGAPLNAWYVSADLSTGKVGLRANCPGGLKTLDEQWSPDCLAMINAGYFYNTNPVGLAVIGSTLKSQTESVRGTLRAPDSGYDIGANEYSQMYNVTRAVFGIDASGKARAIWNWTTHYFDAPLPQFVGDQKYSAPNFSWAEHKVDWAPVDAIGAGPMLVYGGKILPELSESPRGVEYFINNNELIPYDIYNRGVSPDRTAIGLTADGKVVFFVCDGRIKSSDGATIVETAQIMRGLGCVEAVNMDGGGSTAMHLSTGRVNSLEKNTAGATENRAVPTTWCIYKK